MSDENVISIYAYDISSSYAYRARRCSVVDGEANFLYEAVLLILEEKATGRILEVTDFSRIFYESTKPLNSSVATRYNKAKNIAMFLNYMFFTRESISRSEGKQLKNLDKIENLTVDDVNTFFNDYKNGLVGKCFQKSIGSVIEVEKYIKSFCFFLVSKYKMKYIKKKQFKIIESYIKINRTNRKAHSLEGPFTVLYPKKKPKKRLEYVSFYAVAELLKLAVEKDPMIALMIAMGAFSGLRASEVCYSTFYNTTKSYLGLDLRMFIIDLTQPTQMRSDGVSVGIIQSDTPAQVHPAFLPFFDLVYQHHLSYLKQFGKRNKFGAMFMNRDGKAMTYENYVHRFKNLVGMLIPRLQATGNSRIISEANAMLTYSFDHHTLRYFFTQSISSLPDVTVFEVAMFRRDNSLESAMTYIRNNPYIIDDKIKDIQKEFIRLARENHRNK